MFKLLTLQPPSKLLHRHCRIDDFILAHKIDPVRMPLLVYINGKIGDGVAGTDMASINGVSLLKLYAAFLLTWSKKS